MDIVSGGCFMSWQSSIQAWGLLAGFGASMIGCNELRPNAMSQETVDQCSVFLSAHGEEYASAIWDGRADVPDEVRKAEKDWIKILSFYVREGADRQRCEALLDRMSRDKAVSNALGTGRYHIWYLIDDWHQVRLDFWKDNKLQSFLIRERGRWLRTPAGVCLVDVDYTGRPPAK
jgi:hypothetical protein